MVSILIVPLSKRIALRYGLVDDPGSADYKTHHHITPYGGGIAIFLACLLPMATILVFLFCQSTDVFHNESNWVNPWAPYWLFPFSQFSATVLEVSQVITLFTCAAVMWLVGMVDDFKGLTPLFRFLSQLTIAGILVIWVPGFRLPIAETDPVVVIAITILWITAITNAFNFLDNMDGLAAGVAGICTAGCVSLALAGGHIPAAFVGLILTGSVCGFLVYNFPTAKVFMGDCGGLFIGFMVAGLSILVCWRTSETANLSGIISLVPLLTLGVPIYDLSSVVVIRLLRKKPPWNGDQNHTSHRLVRLGLSRRNSVLFLYVITLITVFSTLDIITPSTGSFGFWMALPILAAMALLDCVFFLFRTSHE